VPKVSQTAKIEVRALAQSAFAVVERDILAVDDEPDRMSGHRPLVAGPLREGFRWQQTLVHERRVCRTDWVVAELRSPWVLEQTMEHLCAVSAEEAARLRAVRGGAELGTVVDDESTERAGTAQPLELNIGAVGRRRGRPRRAWGDLVITQMAVDYPDAQGGGYELGVRVQLPPPANRYHRRGSTMHDEAADRAVDELLARSEGRFLPHRHRPVGILA
jgi:hypothetical protein